MNVDTIIRLLKNAGYKVLSTDGVYVHIEDPSCIIRSFEVFFEYAWIAVTVIAAILIFGLAISMIRGAKNSIPNIFTNLRNLTLIFGILAATKPIVNLIYGDDLFGKGCKTVKISIHQIQGILDSKDFKLKDRLENELYEEFDIYDSGATFEQAEQVE